MLSKSMFALPNLSSLCVVGGTEDEDRVVTSRQSQVFAVRAKTRRVNRTGAKPPPLPKEVWDQIRDSLSPDAVRSGDDLWEAGKAIESFCAIHKEACDDAVYFEVVKKYMVLSTPLKQEDLPDCIMSWKELFDNCMCEFKKLPKSMLDAFLNGNPRQLYRWRSVFSTRNLLWLRVVVGLGSVPRKPAVYDHTMQESELVQYEAEEGVQYADVENFWIASADSPRVLTYVQRLIKEGWYFDDQLSWVFGAAINTFLPAFSAPHTHDVADGNVRRFKDLVSMLIDAGAAPEVDMDVFMQIFPIQEHAPIESKCRTFQYISTKLEQLLQHDISCTMHREDARDDTYSYCEQLVDFYLETGRLLQNLQDPIYIYALTPLEKNVPLLLARVASDNELTEYTETLLENRRASFESIELMRFHQTPTSQAPHGSGCCESWS